MSEVSFYYPTFSTGGTQTLLVEIISLLLKYHKVNLYDIRNGYLSTNVPASVNIIFIESSDSGIQNIGNEIFILTGDKIIDISTKLKTTQRVSIIYYDLYFNGIIPMFYGRTLFPRWTAMKMLHTLSRANALCSMTNELFRYYDLKEGLVIPLTSDSKDKHLHWEHTLDAGSSIKIGLVYRNAVNKVKAIDKFISSLPANVDVEFYVITDQPYDDLVSLMNGKAKFSFYGPMKFDEVLLLFKKVKIDVVFTTGKTSLDFASAKYPVLNYDYHYSDKSPKYRWFSELQEYNVGVNLDKEEMVGRYIEELFEELLADSVEISRLCHQRYLDNFSKEALVFSILKIIQKGGLPASELNWDVFPVNNCLRRLQKLKLKIYRN